MYCGNAQAGLAEYLLKVQKYLVSRHVLVCNLFAFTSRLLFQMVGMIYLIQRCKTQCEGLFCSLYLILLY